MKHKYNTGFTLVELMIVSALLAILAGIAIPAYNQYVLTSRKADCLNELAAIQLAMEEYYLENNSYYAGVRSSASNTLSSTAGTTYKGTYSASDNCTYTVAAGASGGRQSRSHPPTRAGSSRGA